MQGGGSFYDDKGYGSYSSTLLPGQEREGREGAGAGEIKAGLGGEGGQSSRRGRAKFK